MSTLSLEKDIAYDARQFLNFLDPNRQDPSYRFRILKKYPALSAIQDTSSEEYGTIFEFLSELYQSHEKTIETVLESQGVIDQIFPKAWDALIQSMSCQNVPKKSYRAVLSFLPMYPFDYQANTFCVDALASNPLRTVETAIHEISHFLYFDYLKASGYSDFLESNAWGKYVAKESITPIIMRNGALRIIFQKSFNANKNVALLQHSASEKLVDHFERAFFRETTDFLVFAKCVTDFCIEYQTILAERKHCWDQSHQSGISDQERDQWLAAMAEPIMRREN